MRGWFPGVILAGLTLAGCGSEPEPLEYSEANRQAFMAACTDASVDSPNTAEVCGCVYNRVAQTFTVVELAEIDNGLLLDALTDIPDEVGGYIAECFIHYSELDKIG